MTRFTFHVGDVVSLSSENSEILDFLTGRAWRAQILTADHGAYPVIFEILCQNPPWRAWTVH